MAQATTRGVVYGVYHGSEGSGISVAARGMLKTTNGRNGAKTNSQRRSFMGFLRHSGKASRLKDFALSPNGMAMSGGTALFAVSVRSIGGVGRTTERNRIGNPPL